MHLPTVPANGHLPSNHPEQQLDTLTNLQQEALYLSKKDIRDLKIIGHGACCDMAFLLVHVHMMH